MRRKSLLERVRLLGRSAIDVLAVLGRSCLFLFHALIGRGGIGGGFQLLTKQLYSVGVLSLAIIVVSGVFIGMVHNWRLTPGYPLEERLTEAAKWICVMLRRSPQG